MTLFCLNRGSTVLGLALGLAGIAATRATAQAGFEIGPTLGYYLTNGAERPNDGPNAPGNFSAPLYGGQLTIWSRGRLGIRAESGAAWTSREMTTNPGGFTPEEAGHLVEGSVAVVFAMDAAQPHRLWISAGPGFVGYRGPAFESSGSPTEAAAVLGIGGSRSINDAFGVTWSISTLLYEYQGILGDIGGPPSFDGTTRDGSVGRRFRSDVLLQASITMKGHS